MSVGMQTWWRRESDGAISELGWFERNGWWIPHLNQVSSAGQYLRSRLLGGVQCSDPYRSTESVVASYAEDFRR